MTRPTPGPGSEGQAASAPATELVARVERLAELADDRWRRATPYPPAALERARQLRDHVRSFLLPRARNLDAPLLVILLGPTGAGKSTLFNTLAGAAVSRTGVLRPTTRDAVLLATPGDAALLRESALEAIASERIAIVSDGARDGIAIADVPDIDSVERENRALADALVEAADLCIFVTTAVRYADRVPWDVLRRVRERGLPLLVVVNRLPRDDSEARTVLDDVARLMREGSLDTHDEERRLGIVAVREGDVAPATHGLAPETVGIVLARMEQLASDRDARRQLAAEALAGALGGASELVHRVADDLEHEAIDADALRRSAEAAYADETRALEDELRKGAFLREEILRQWQAFVGADEITRFFARGIGRVRGALLARLRGTPAAPVALVQHEATSDLVAVALAHARDAARRTANAWQQEPLGGAIVASDPTLWSAGSDFAARLDDGLRAWLAAIADEVSAAAASKRGLARGASIGVSAAGATVMLSVFAHTGGLTGAEVGVAAATGFLNARLLEALFGEAAMRELIDSARRRLFETLQAAMDAERARYERLAPPAAELRTLAADLRSALAGPPV